MKTSAWTICGAALAVVILGGCTTAPTARGPIPAKYYSKAELEDLDEVKLPPNYSVDNFRKMQMVMNIKIESADGKTKIDKGLSTRMQTEMAKLKRFEIFRFTTVARSNWMRSGILTTKSRWWGRTRSRRAT